MVSSKKWLAGTALALTAVLTACAGGGSAESSPSSGTREIVLGLQTASTGPLASSYGAGAIEAAKARIAKANATNEVPGVTFKLETADENSSPAGALAASQSLVERKKAFAVLAAGPYFFGAYRYLVQKNVPVYGVGTDGPEWADPANKNLFAYSGSTDPDFPTYLGMGEYMKSRGVTKFCGITYGNSASYNTGAAMMASVEHDGVPVVYRNVSVPLGGTDFTAAAIAIKDSGCDGLGTWMVVSSDIALFQALKNVGIDGSYFKGSYITGVYGQELLDCRLP